MQKSLNNAQRELKQWKLGLTNFCILFRLHSSSLFESVFKAGERSVESLHTKSKSLLSQGLAWGETCSIWLLPRGSDWFISAARCSYQSRIGRVLGTETSVRANVWLAERVGVSDGKRGRKDERKEDGWRETENSRRQRIGAVTDEKEVQRSRQKQPGPLLNHFKEESIPHELNTWPAHVWATLIWSLLYTQAHSGSCGRQLVEWVHGLPQGMAAEYPNVWRHCSGPAFALCTHTVWVK